MKEKILIFLMVISMGAFSQSSKKVDYTKVHNGKFYIEDETTGAFYWIERNDSVQVEYFNRKKEMARFKVEWINERKYSLLLIEGSESLKDYSKTDKLIVKIIAINDKGYQYVAKMKGKKSLKGWIYFAPKG